MKTLILISAFLVAVTSTKLSAQVKSPIEIQHLNNGVIQNENNQFKIISHEELEVNLKFNLKKSDSYQVLILNNYNQIVYSKIINKEGVNKVTFNTEEEGQYTIKLISEKKTNLVAYLNKN